VEELGGRPHVVVDGPIGIDRVLVARDYNCVDGTGAAVVTNPDTVSTCSSPPSGRSPDILGLSAKYDVLVSHNDPTDQVTQSTGTAWGTVSATVRGRLSTPRPGDAEREPL
jgi:hypothetical protein